MEMNEIQKAAAGLLYDANFDPEILKMRLKTKQTLFEFNQTPPEKQEERNSILKNLFGKIGSSFVIEGPVHCDYGFNIEIGDNFYANVNLVILDGAKVTIGDNVFIAPNTGIYTAGHPLEKDLRNQGLEYAKPVHIGNNVWIGAGVSIMPGVTIGDDTVIGVGSVVTRSIPSGVVAVGNPCKVLKKIASTDYQT